MTNTTEKEELEMKWVEEYCECGIDKNGSWNEELFEEFGCSCYGNTPIAEKSND